MSKDNGLFMAETITKIVMLLLNTFGNILVIQAIARSRRLRTASNYLVANLAVCDLLSPLLNIPIDILVDVAEQSWNYGPIMCKLIWPFATLLTISSALTLVGISIDRSRALRHPFVTRLTPRQSLGIILLIHGLSSIIIIPYAKASVVIDGRCVEDWSGSYFNPKQYTLVLFHAQYLIPLVILAFVYGEVACYLRRSTRNLVRFEVVPENQRKRKADVSFSRRRHPFQGVKRPQRQSLRVRQEQNARVIKMFAVVVALFAVFMLPNNIRWLLMDFGNYSQYEHADIISFFCTTFTYANCLANPIIYGTLSRDFKKHFLRPLTLSRHTKTKITKTRVSQHHPNSTLHISNRLLRRKSLV